MKIPLLPFVMSVALVPALAHPAEKEPNRLLEQKLELESDDGRKVKATIHSFQEDGVNITTDRITEPIFLPWKKLSIASSLRLKELREKNLSPAVDIKFYPSRKLYLISPVLEPTKPIDGRFLSLAPAIVFHSGKDPVLMLGATQKSKGGIRDPSSDHRGHVRRKEAQGDYETNAAQKPQARCKRQLHGIVHRERRWNHA